jgi:hypothetical protein
MPSPMIHLLAAYEVNPKAPIYSGLGTLLLIM